MSVKTTTTWTCDRCETTETFDSANTEPLGWVRLVEVSPPRGLLTDRAKDAGTVCSTCSAEFDEWMAANR